MKASKKSNKQQAVPREAPEEDAYEERFLDLWRDSLAAGLTPYLPESGAFSLKDLSTSLGGHMQGAAQTVSDAAVRALKEAETGMPFGFASQAARWPSTAGADAATSTANTATTGDAAHSARTGAGDTAAQPRSERDSQAAHGFGEQAPRPAPSPASKPTDGTPRVPRALALTLSQMGALWGASPLVAAQLAAHFNWQKLSGDKAAASKAQGSGQDSEQDSEQSSGQSSGQGSGHDAGQGGAQFAPAFQQVSEAFADYFAPYFNKLSVEQASALPAATAARAPKRLHKALFGLNRYMRARYRRAPGYEGGEIIWRRGSCAVWDLAAKDAASRPQARTKRGEVQAGKPIFLVPSLVNRAYILDLMPGHSFTDYLKQEGWRPYLLDWGEPQQDSEALSLEAYITERLLPAFDAACIHAAGAAEPAAKPAARRKKAQQNAASTEIKRQALRRDEAQATGQAAENATENATEIAAENAPGNRTENAPDYASGHAAHKIAENAQGYNFGQPSNPIGMPVLGYCMGGTLSVALARLRPKSVTSLALLAAPWDMHQDAAHPFVTLSPLLSGLAHMFDHVTKEVVQAAMLGKVQPRFQPSQTVSADLLQALFNMLDPTLNDRKFSRFASVPDDSLYYSYFLALEHWANDGQDLSLSVAADCITKWYKDNLTGRRQWHVGGQCIDPALVTQPSLVVLPKQDRLVSEASAAALVQQLPNAQPLHAHGGHVSMVAGLRARTHLWEPLSTWLQAHS